MKWLGARGQSPQLWIFMCFGRCMCRLIAHANYMLCSRSNGCHKGRTSCCQSVAQWLLLRIDVDVFTAGVLLTQESVSQISIIFLWQVNHAKSSHEVKVTCLVIIECRPTLSPVVMWSTWGLVHFMLTWISCNVVGWEDRSWSVTQKRFIFWRAEDVLVNFMSVQWSLKWKCLPLGVRKGSFILASSCCDISCSGPNCLADWPNDKTTM